MAGDDAEDTEMQVYVDLFRKLDEKRQGLDFEIHDILAELDTVASFDEVENKKVEEIPKESKLGQLIDKLVSRQKEIEFQQQKIKSYYNSSDTYKNN